MCGIIRFFCLLLALSMMSSQLCAQGWKTVRSDDSVYFIGGPAGGNERYLKIIWIDSSKANGTDTTFYFYKTLRDTSLSCLDTLGATWLGKRMVRQQNGDELYFNKPADTILVKTLAPLGSSWTLGQSQTGRSFQATVTQAGVTTVEGVSDSFKTISIQTFQNGQPINDWYNGMVLELSKNHGWLKALDFYIFPFPDVIWPQHFVGAVSEYHQQVRLPAVFNKGLDHVDVDLKYQTGNAWIKAVTNIVGTGLFQYDSVISAQQISPGVVQAVVKTAYVSTQYVNNQLVYSFGAPSTVTGIITSNSTGSLSSSGVLPEYIGQDTLHSAMSDNLHKKKVTVDSVCNGTCLAIRYRTVSPATDIYYSLADSCLVAPANISGYYYNDHAYLPGFGMIEDAHVWDYMMTKMHHPYIKLGNCIMGYVPNFFQPLTPADWKTVSQNDSAYFIGGSTSWTSEKLLKLIWVDSVTANGGDSIFYFYRTIRDTAAGACMDTLGPSWLGKMMIRQSNGDERYFNRYGDTILIRTHAPVGTSWILAKNIHGRVYEGTVSQSGLTFNDSFKTITIQAFENGVPVNDWYNQKILQLSKKHGWLTALDFYTFPYSDITVLQTGAVPDTGQLTRLPEGFNTTCLENDNLLYKYAPGNEWIREIDNRPFDDLGAPPSYYAIEHDSVISSSAISPQLISVTMKTTSYFKTYNQQTTFSSSFGSGVHTDLIPRCPTGKIIDSVIPEYKGSFSFNQPGNLGYKTWYVDSVCTSGQNKLISETSFSRSVFTNPANCVATIPAINISPFERVEYLIRFGEVARQKITPIGTYNYFEENLAHPYIKLGNCVHGVKTQILHVDDRLVSPPSVSIWPNPAKGVVHIDIPPVHAAEVNIFDPSGRLVLNQQLLPGDQEVDISRLAPDIYILHIHTNGKLSIQKLAVLN